MAIISIADLKAKFEPGDKPGSSDFIDLIDTLADDTTAIHIGINQPSDGSETPLWFNESTEVLSVFDGVDWIAVSGAGGSGTDGLSAYEVAVENGFVGTEVEWLASLIGADGPQGATGATGPQGETGPQGIQGIQGEAGPAGADGATGPQGIQGIQGIQGETGAQGPQGIQGETGPQGIQGETGAVGPTGATGITWQGTWDSNTDYVNNDAVYYNNSSWFASGDPGVGDVPSEVSAYWFPLALQGATGATGPQGETGATGAAGADGADGADGSYYVSDNKPSSPIAGDIWFNSATGKSYIYYTDADNSQWVEITSNTMGYLDIGQLNDVSVATAADGQALLYDASSSSWVPGSAAPSGVNTISSDNIDIDFSDNVPLETRAVTGDVVITATNYTPGSTKRIYFSGDTVKRNLSLPAEWEFVENNKPVAIGANRNNLLELNSFGNSASSTVGIWIGVSAYDPMVAIGGVETEVVVSGVTYKVHTFNSSGTLNVTNLGDDNGVVEYLLVGGGGGGGGWNGPAGGGGAGGLLQHSAYSIPGTAQYPVTIGLGGAGGNTTGSPAHGSKGADSSVFTVIAYGGGGGNEAYYQQASASILNGGSGGGGGNRYNISGAGGTATQTSQAGAVGYGNDGGVGGPYSDPYYGAGGGGATQVGSGSGGVPNGGAGFESLISGFSQFYAGGGGGGGASSAVAGSGGSSVGGDGRNGGVGYDAVANTGSGGGGGSGGGDGSNGIFILRYPITDPN